MISLFNGCSRSKISVTPKNWNTKKASINRPWRICYRFYDPAFKDHPKLWGKQVPIKGMNEYHTLEERQSITKGLIENEMELLDKKGYNPITCQYMAPELPAGQSPSDITAGTPLSESLVRALELCDIDPDTKIDMRSCLKYFCLSAEKLNKDLVPVKDIKRKDIRAILDNCKNLMVVENGVERPKIWSSNQFNHYRKYLQIIYSQLEELEVIDYNPIEKISKKTVDPPKRETLTPEQRILIDKYLLDTHPIFHRFVNIFYHSGSRRKEMLRLQGKDVDLAGQRFRLLIKKGKHRRWVWKTIKDIAMPFWIEQMVNCRPEDFVFGYGMLPSAKPVRPDKITRRWRSLIKERLRINVDFYPLKHLHTTEVKDIIERDVAEEIANKEAAEHNSHTTEAMVVKIYDTKHASRKHNRIKKIRNSFAG